jgi:hypothetical protein
MLAGIAKQCEAQTKEYYILKNVYELHLLILLLN